MKTLIGLLLCLSLGACISSQTTSFKITEQVYPAKSESFDVTIFKEDLPKRNFTRIARLNYHVEKTFLGPSWTVTAYEELKKQARKIGADAIIEVKQTRSRLNETLILNVSAVAIVFEKQKEP